MLFPLTAAPCTTFLNLESNPTFMPVSAPYLPSLCLHVTQVCPLLGCGQVTHQLFGGHSGTSSPLHLLLYLLILFLILHMSLFQAAVLKASHTHGNPWVCNPRHGQDLQEINTHIHPSCWAGPLPLSGLWSPRATQEEILWIASLAAEVISKVPRAE